MRKSILSILLLTIFIIQGCSANTDCFTADSIDQLKLFDRNEKKYALFLRISGLQEKQAFYELYLGVPVFDKCGQPGTKPLSMIHIDTNLGAVSRVVVENEKLDLVYSGKDTGNTGLKDVIVEIKRR